MKHHSILFTYIFYIKHRFIWFISYIFTMSIVCVNSSFGVIGVIGIIDVFHVPDLKEDYM